MWKHSLFKNLNAGIIVTIILPVSRIECTAALYENIKELLEIRDRDDVQDIKYQ